MARAVQIQVKTKILVVDDESAIRELLSGFLESEGYVVHTAKSGNEALTEADEFEPDLIMLDIILPDLDGISVYQELKKKSASSRIPVIFFSTLGKESIPHSFKEESHTPYALISKPVKEDLLIREVKKLLKVSEHPKEST